MAGHGVETRDFFLPIHVQPSYREEVGSLRLCKAEDLASRGFYLPVHTDMTPQDVTAICDIIRGFYSDDHEPMPAFSERRDTKSVFRVISDQLPLVRALTIDSNLKKTTASQAAHCTSRLLSESQRYLRHASYGGARTLLESCREILGLIQDNHPQLAKEVKGYRDFYESELKMLSAPIQGGKKPWQAVRLEDYPQAAAIPSMTEEESLKLLAWLVREFDVQDILEIGTWLGKSAVLMAEAGKGRVKRIAAVDEFTYYPWMEMYGCEPGNNRLTSFQQNIIGFTDIIKPIKWTVPVAEGTDDCGLSIPNLESAEKLDLVCLDFASPSEELEVGWSVVSKHFEAGRTLLYISGLSDKSYQFLARHSGELEAIAIPSSNTRVYRYIGTDAEMLTPGSEDKTSGLDVTVNFHTSPGWSHHHQNAFDQAIDALRVKFHDPEATVRFIPALEQYICDDMLDQEDLDETPWIAIVHNALNMPEFFYVPDLERLCSERMQYLFRNCKGLFTLTQFQSDYLRANFKASNKIPIQSLKYPLVEYITTSKLNLDSNQIPLLLVGSYARDFAYFFRVKVPSTFKKTVLVGDSNMEKKTKGAPEDIKLLPRASSSEYEHLLRSSVLILPLTTDGAANTLILECIARNAPIAAPELESCREYLGSDYPLLYDPNEDDLGEVLMKEKILAAITHLKTMNKDHLTLESFCTSVKESTLLQSLPANHMGQEYDVTVMICSYRRTNHLPDILNCLWSRQNFKGSIHILVWNNNYDRRETVDIMCDDYKCHVGSDRRLDIIHSTQNYYCIVRLCAPHLIRSKRLLICDDDIQPGEEFVDFFLQAHRQHPRDIVCIRGHFYLPHTLTDQNPEHQTWEEYDKLRFADDHKPSRLLHFPHMDTCIIPKEVLQEVGSVDMPDR